MKKSGFTDSQILAILKQVEKGLITMDQESSLELSPLHTGQPKRMFSVVTACYNSEQYLDDYFTSLVEQTIDFKNYIEVICVDDGSTDGTAELVKRWMEQYPNNIRYIYKENGGAASARNVGLSFASGTWITCIDSDDYVAKNYFQLVWTHLKKPKNSRVRLVLCNQLAYYEANGRKVANHPLGFRFKKMAHSFTLTEQTPFIHIVTSCAFMYRDLLLSNQISYNESIEPTFEDGELMLRYMKAMEYYDVLLEPKARYYARKRVAATSLYTSALDKPSYYTVPFEAGMLPLLTYMNDKYGTIPAYVKQTILFILKQNLRRVSSHYASLAQFGPELEERFLNNFVKILKFIDINSIQNTVHDASFPDYIKFLFITHFKNEQMPFELVRVVKVDLDQKMLLLSYYSVPGQPRMKFSLNGKQLAPVVEKLRCQRLLGSLSIHEVFVWIRYTDKDDILAIEQTREGAGPAFFQTKEQRYDGRIACSHLLAGFEVKKNATKSLPWVRRLLLSYLRMPWIKKKYEGSWLFIDRVERADDNAEHMYKYMKKEHPETSCFFVLSPSSPCWKRLKEQGVRLIAYKSFAYYQAMMLCKFVLSSHLGKEVTLSPKSWRTPYLKFKFIYFGHGPMKDDISTLLNRFNIDLFTRVTKAEYAYITQDMSPYTLTTKEVVLTGFPRYDSLLAPGEDPENVILFSPTWRRDLAQPGVSGRREAREAFSTTPYAKSIHSFLWSSGLATLLERFGYRFIFLPHPNMLQYMEEFVTPDYVKKGRPEDFGGYQTLFQKCKILITDYSSISFDMALLGKAILYYQFDHSKIFDGSHTTAKGYFEYPRDGFGPVATDEECLLNELGTILQRGGEPSPEYAHRMAATFPFRDVHNCERVYEAILNLNRQK